MRSTRRWDRRGRGQRGRQGERRTGEYDCSKRWPERASLWSGDVDPDSAPDWRQGLVAVFVPVCACPPWFQRVAPSARTLLASLPTTALPLAIALDDDETAPAVHPAELNEDAVVGHECDPAISEWSWQVCLRMWEHEKMPGFVESTSK